MAIRVAKSLYNNDTIYDQKTVDTDPSVVNDQGALGFEIRCTDGNEYDLEKLVKDHDRESSEMPLILEVKRDLAEKAIEEMKEVLNYKIKASLENEDVTSVIYEEVVSVFRKYGYCYNSVTDELYLDKVRNEQIPIEAYRELNRRINKRFREIYDNNFEYTITFENNGSTYRITYKYLNDDELKTEFAKYYDNFIRIYTEEKLKVEQEGGLAIDAEKGKIEVNKEDFERYLLDENPSEGGSVDNYTVGARSVKVIWEEGKTLDEREQEEVQKGIYETIQDLENSVEEVTNLIGTGKIGDLQFEDIDVNRPVADILDLDPSEAEKYQVVEKRVMLLKKD